MHEELADGYVSTVCTYSVTILHTPFEMYAVIIQSISKSAYILWNSYVHVKVGALET